MTKKKTSIVESTRWLATRIYRTGCAAANGFWWVIRLMMLFVVAFFRGIWEIIKAFGRWPGFFVNAWRDR
jgi:hypothetical protein